MIRMALEIKSIDEYFKACDDFQKDVTYKEYLEIYEMDSLLWAKFK